MKLSPRFVGKHKKLVPGSRIIARQGGQRIKPALKTIECAYGLLVLSFGHSSCVSHLRLHMGWIGQKEQIDVRPVGRRQQGDLPSTAGRAQLQLV